MTDEKPEPQTQPPPQECPSGPPGEAPAKASALDALFLTPEEAAAAEAAKQVQAPKPVFDNPPDPEEEEPEEAAPLLAEEVEKICKAIDRLARKGLNLRAVIALLHDSNPTIPKKHIKTILEGLRELPAIYGRDLRSTDPLRRS